MTDDTGIMRITGGNENEGLPIFLTYAEASALLRISKDTIARAASRGELRRFGSMGRVFFALPELLEWFAKPKPKRLNPPRIYNRDMRAPNSNQGW